MDELTAWLDIASIITDFDPMVYGILIKQGGKISLLPDILQ